MESCHRLEKTDNIDVCVFTINKSVESCKIESVKSLLAGKE
jgi:hypothetical protein